VHISRVELAEGLNMGLMKMLRPRSFKNGRIVAKAVVQVIRVFSMRGLSCCVGAQLVISLERHSDRDWASAMLASIRMRREGRRPEDAVCRIELAPELRRATSGIPEAD
jgi:hypothetical protein